MSRAFSLPAPPLQALLAAWPEFVPLVQVARGLLDRLPDSILYHDTDHTLRDVFPTAVALAEREGCDRATTIRVGVAALFHDVGYLERYADNEPIGVRMARALLPEHGFSAADLDEIEALILATQVPQRPKTLGERVLCDADLAHLSTALCFLVGERLRLERNLHGDSIDLRAWYEANERFLAGHTYHTETARSAWQPGKERNLALARRLLSGGAP